MMDTDKNEVPEGSGEAEKGAPVSRPKVGVYDRPAPPAFGMNPIMIVSMIVIAIVVAVIIF